MKKTKAGIPGISRMLMALAWMVLAVSGCTKERPAQLPDGQRENILEKALFSSTETAVRTAKKSAMIAEAQKLRSYGEGNLVSIESANTSAAIQPMFKGFYFRGKAASEYTVRFEINRKFITAYKVADLANDLTAEELQISIRTQNGMILVPLFQYQVQAYGQLVRTKNDLEEDTSQLRLKPTDWEEATHIQVSTLAKDRLPVSAATQDIAERIFSRERIDQEVLTREELLNNLSISVDGENSDLFFTELDGSQLNLYEITTFDSEELTDSQRELIRSQDNGGVGDPSVLRCSDAIKARLGKGSKITERNCVMVLRYKVPITHVQARREAVDSDGTLGNVIGYVNADSPDQSRLIRIDKDPAVSEVGTLGMDPRRRLVVDELRNAKFFFRRTLQDSPNSFNYTFAGSSGPMELVKFAFDKERVRVVRVDPIVKGSGSTVVDVQELLNLPVKYFREITKDAEGNTLAKPRRVDADYNTPGAIAYVEWEGNSIPTVSSPLDYYSLGQCFIGPNDRSISEVDHRLGTDGLLSFSLTSTYTNNPSMDCAGVYEADYFDTVQTTFTFKERLSFKRYQEGDEKPLLEIPYDAQKKLGFGLFTYKKFTPNQFGNTGTDGTETPLPAIFDIRGGKPITYVLAGLPEDQDLRDRIVKATREVVADWNAAFRKAFTGTAMERPVGPEGDVVILQVEGESGVKAGTLGDLDKNHIYYVQKRTTNSIIGLGGAHANPRSGKVEAASVFIYGGNILSYVERLKKMELARQQYRAIHGIASTEADPAVVAGDTSGSAEGSSTSRATSQLGQSDSGLSGRSVSVSKLPQDSAALRGKLEAYLGQASEAVSEPVKAQALRQTSRSRMSQALNEALGEGIRAGSLQNARRMEVILDQKLAEAMAGKLPEEQVSQLRNRAKRLEAVSRLMERMQQANICVYDVAESGLANTGEDLAKMDDLDILVAVYKPTLAHEIGHNLGLRHNFISSFDKDNWKFEEREESKRDYSSIMDYLEDDHVTYDGLGPQDVAAVRAAYAGLVELAPETAAKAVDEGGKKVLKDADGKVRAELVDGRFLRIADYLGAAGLNSWLDLNANTIGRLKLKKYLFCSDEDSGVFPTCKPFDKGATPSEIVQNVIKDYRELYSITNFPNDKLRFSLADSGAYIGKLFSKFVPIRQFLEETLYLAINGAESKVVNSYVEGAVEAMMLFQEIIRTPDAPVAAELEERFTAVKQSNGSKLVVERKWLEDQAEDMDSDRLKARGIEFDKVISLIMLTQRQFGFSRYERASLRISFPEFEKLAMDAKTPLDLPTIGLLNEILENNIMPAAPTAKGLAGLGGRFKAKTTEMMRYYAVMGGIMNLDVDGLEASDNNSALFRVMSGFRAQEKGTSVVQPGANPASQSVLKYWAPENAAVSVNLIGKIAMLSKLSEKKDELVSGFEALMVKKLELDKESAPAEANPPAPASGPGKKEEFEKAVAEMDQMLSQLPESIGSRSSAEILDVMGSILDLARQLEGLKNALPEHQMALLLDEQRTQLESIARNMPVVGIAMRALTAGKFGISVLDKLVPASVLETDQGVVFGNVEILNRLFYMMHTEYQR